MRRKREHASPLEGDAFTALYRNHAEGLLIFLTRRTLDAEAAMDLTSEIFARALLSRSRFRGHSADDAKAWLFGIARNLLAEYWRTGAIERRALERTGIEPPTLSPQEIERVEELADTRALRLAAHDGFVELSASEREALQLRVIEELSYREVAARLGLKEPAARARVSRALRALAKRLDTVDLGGTPR
jgi:RNA polymerase sigma-70 factor, ECF subfamily